jgi:transposase-like protein
MVPRKRHSTEQIIGKLREADVQLAKGVSVGEICRALAISEHTYYRWRKEYGGLKLDQARRLKGLERENVRLKKLVADQALDNSILREAAKGNF